MSDSKKKVIEYAIGFALSVAGGYFVLYVQWNDLFFWPSYVTNVISIFIGVLLLLYVLFLTRFLVVKYHDSKQIPFPSFFAMGGGRSYGRYGVEQWNFAGFKWEVEYNLESQKIYETRGPYCPNEECHTELNVKETYFGRHKYTCPACSFKKTITENSYTLEHNLEKVSKGKKNKENGRWRKMD